MITLKRSLIAQSQKLVTARPQILLELGPDSVPKSGGSFHGSMPDTRDSNENRLYYNSHNHNHSHGNIHNHNHNHPQNRHPHVHHTPDGRYPGPGQHYVEYGPRTSGGMPPGYTPDDHRRSQPGINKYLQQYLPPHLLNKENLEGRNQAKPPSDRQFVEQVIGPPKADKSPRGPDPQSEISNYNISTEL